MRSRESPHRWSATAAVALALLMIAWSIVPGVDAFSYRYASFATAHPKAAVHFCVTYLDAVPIFKNYTRKGRPWEDSDDNEVAGVRLPYDGTYSDIYFPHAKRGNEAPGAVSVEEVNAVRKGHGFAPA